MCQFLLGLQGAAEVQSDVGDLILIEQDPGLFLDQAGELDRDVVDEGTGLADLRDQRVADEVLVDRPDQHIVDMQREADEEFLLIQVETVVLLSKVDKSTKKVYVDFPLEDMDMSGFVDGATYQEIKLYVKENYKLNVSNLNIAQTKEKYGIKERENYNFSKKGNVKRPRCTQEKEEAILDAFKHFNMI